jgi:conjugal transfer ATP-binding protein TraC
MLKTIERCRNASIYRNTHIYQLSSISSNFQSERPYSEIFIMRGDKHQIYRLEVPKEVYWAYQTEGKENQKLMEIYDKVQNMEEKRTLL